MIINSIELYNFRQYKGRQKIKFSTDKERNVTIIKGENGAGKTTLLEAFTWCFYKDIKLPNSQNLITADIANNMKPRGEDTVYAEISFIHNNKGYIIKRTQEFRKANDGEIVGCGQEVSLKVKEKTGELRQLKISELDSIVPSDLSTYFFFDGERIENISKSNKDGKKDLNKAIRNILGLDVLLNSDKHLEKVITEFNKDYNHDANSILLQKSIEIEEKKSRLEQYLGDKKVLEEENKVIEDKLERISKKLLEFSEVKAFEAERNGKINQCKSLKEQIENLEKDIQKINKRSLPEFFAKKILHLCNKDINLESLESRGIIGIDGAAIDYLLERKECICGQKLSAGSSYFNALIKQKEYQPPASLGIILKEFNEKSDNVKRAADEFKVDIKAKLSDLGRIKTDIYQLEDDIRELGDKIKGIEKSRELEENRCELERDKRKNNDDIHNIDNYIKELKSDISSLEAQLSKLALDDSKNEIIVLRQEYAKKVLEAIRKFYNKKEEDIKDKLNRRVTDIFSQLLCTNHRIEIGEDYTFKVIDIDGEESTSQGQDVITSFAFIGGIIDLAKANHKEIEVNEPYPLIMDAPFAKLSKTHRKNVAQLLPGIAEQFILITVDSQYEGDIEEALKPKIGKYYEIVMHNENEKYTEVVEGDSYV